MSKRWFAIGAIIVIAAAATVVGVRLGSGNDTPADGSADGELEFEEVSFRDLDEITTLDGTLGFPEGDPVTSRLHGTITEVALAGEVVEEGDVLFSVDGEPVALLQGSLPAYRDIGSEPNLRTVASQSTGTITGLPEVDDVLAFNDEAIRINDLPVLVLPGDLPAWRDLDEGDEGSDVEQLESALVGLGHDPGDLTVDESFTSHTDLMIDSWQEGVGLEIDGRFDLGDAFFLPSEPVVVEVLVEFGDTANVGTPLLVVDVAVAGDSEIETGDTDVLQLQEALQRLGYSVPATGIVDEATISAIEAWQTDIGAVVDGKVDLGEVIFLPEGVRVTEALVTIGGPVNDGTPVLATSASSSVVVVDLPADNQELLEVGMTLTVEMPDGSEILAGVTVISGIAIRNQAGNVVFETEIELTDTTVGADLDQAPVDVLVVTDSRSQVLAVPVTALLALAEGGYAVEVELADGSLQLTGVEPGLYADGWVEVTSEALAAGDRVVVP